MYSRERVYRALQFNSPDRVPRDLWVMPPIVIKQSTDLQEVLDRFPVDFAQPVDVTGASVGVWGSLRIDLTNRPAPFHYGEARRARGEPYKVGSYVDAWGVPWEVAEDGIMGEVKYPPLAEWSALDHFTPPWELLDDANWGSVNRFCGETDKFVVTPWGVNPFERMQFLRGSENLYLDLGYGSSEVLRLMNIVHDYYRKEIELWCKTDVDGIKFSDDWGSQTSLLISPILWREIFKPLYAEYVRIIHAARKFVFFHSDGNISKIIPDLIELGVDALNSQLFCMDIEELGRKYKGQITFWGEIDRQHVMPFYTSNEVRHAVHRVRDALDTGYGGVISQVEWGKDVPRQNVEAVFEAWL